MTFEPLAAPPETAVREADLAMARLHLRLGSLSLARAELEALAGKDGLDDEGILDLAEVRWRTGDLAGAGEAATARLETNPDDVIALVIAAESQADLGRPSEARRLAGRALNHFDGPIDSIFAGMPRSSIWPIDASTPVEPAGELFEDLPRPRGSLFARSAPAEVAADEATKSGGAAAASSAGEASGQSLWEAHEDTIAPILPDSGELLSRARAALDAGRPGQAAAALALALRAESGLAPTVLDLIAGRQEPVLALVRGDANRIVGHEAEALRDYAAAVAAIDSQRRSDDRTAEPNEAGRGRSRRHKSAETDNEQGAATVEAATAEAADTEAAERRAAELATAEQQAAELAAAERPDPQSESTHPKENT